MKTLVFNFLKVYKVAFVILIILISSFNIKENNSLSNEQGLQVYFNYNLTTTFIHPPFISAVINDNNDPLAINGFVIDIKKNNQLINTGDYEITAESSNTDVITVNQIKIDKQNGYANIQLHPVKIGYTDIDFIVTYQKSKTNITVHLAVSSFEKNKALTTYWHTGISDASAVVDLDSNYMLVADDEVNALFVYNRFASGLPVKAFTYEKYLQLEEDKEVDIEAGARSPIHPEKIYWLASMTNGGKSFKQEPNRKILFSSNIIATGNQTQFTFNGFYKHLRKAVIKWGDAHQYKFSASAQEGSQPKKIDGFNIEGITFAPDNSTLYVGFRAPLVSVTERNKAVIMPIRNFEQWFNNGKILLEPVLEEPIELDLDGRSIRDFIKLKNGKYIIIAGSCNEVLNGAIYLWDGVAAAKPILLNDKEVNQLKMESGLEILGNGNLQIQVLSDNGSDFFYDENTAAKLLNSHYKKFRSDVIHFQF